MSRIWMFHIENILKNAVITARPLDGTFNTLYELRNKNGVHLAYISDDIYITPTIQLKLTKEDYSIWEKYRKNVSLNDNSSVS